MIIAGEIASNWPIHQFEKNVLVASAHIQSELNVPVIIHPGRNTEAPFEVMRIFAEAGGKVAKTVMSHLDSESHLFASASILMNTLLNFMTGTLSVEEIVEFAATGTICELDLFGNEVSYYELSAEFDMPNDANRIAQLKALIDNGYADQITISHDIHTKHRLV